MIITKIKYRGEWRTVVGIATVDINEGMTINRSPAKCYKVKSNVFSFGYNYIPVDDDKITEVVKDEKRVRYPSGKKRYNQLTEEERQLIYNKYQTGWHYIKDICKSHKISVHTFNRIVREYDELRSKTKDL